MKPQGMSDHAWIRIHQLVAHLEIKYMDKLNKRKGA